MKQLTNDEFIAKAKLIHGDKYEYSLTQYIGNKNKVSIICPCHGEFKQRAGVHIGKQKQGCMKCAGEKRQIGLESFLLKANLVHANKYDYSLITEYKPNRAYFDVICRTHGLFTIYTVTMTH